MKYKYNGDGAGVPGLPHEISEAEYASFNREQVKALEDALKSGVYVEAAPSRKFIKKSIEAGASPSPEPTEGDRS